MPALLPAFTAKLAKDVYDVIEKDADVDKALDVISRRRGGVFLVPTLPRGNAYRPESIRSCCGRPAYFRNASPTVYTPTQATKPAEQKVTNRTFSSAQYRILRTDDLRLPKSPR